MNQPSATTDFHPEDSNVPPTAEERSLARGVVYRFIAAAFRYPEPDTWSAFREQERAMSEAVAVLSEGSDGRLAERFAELKQEAERSTSDVLESDYVSLFGHAVRGRCPLYEAEYGEGDERLQQPHELSDLFAFYRAFGLTLGEGLGERVDFIVVECEFMAFLSVKQAYAEEHEDEALAAVTLDAQGKFLRDHLGRWTPACTRKIVDQSRDSFYGLLARLTLDYVNGECQRLGVLPGKEHLKLRLPLKEADASLSCPMAERSSDADTGPSFPPKV